MSSMQSDSTNFPLTAQIQKQKHTNAVLLFAQLLIQLRAVIEDKIRPVRLHGSSTNANS